MPTSLPEPPLSSQPTAHLTGGEDMTLIEHLEELRWRIIVSSVAVCLASLLVFCWQAPLVTILEQPLRHQAFKQAPVTLIITAPGEYFIAIVKLSLLGGLYLALPVILHQLLKFISPGLLPEEKRWAIPTVVGAFAAFSVGALFGFYLLLPTGLQFLVGFAPSEIKPMLSVAKYLGFAGGLTFAVGLAFELPIFLIAASRLGVVTSYSLARHRKNVFLGAFVLAALITPSVDIFTQVLLATALYTLFELSLAIIRMTGR